MNIMITRLQKEHFRSTKKATIPIFFMVLRWLRPPDDFRENYVDFSYKMYKKKWKRMVYIML